MTTSSPDPYKNGIQHLEDEIRVLTAHSRRLAFQKNNAEHHNDDTQARLEWLERLEQATRLEVEARTQVSLEEGVTLPLVTLRKKSDLSNVEMTAFLMAVVPAFGLDVSEVLSGLQPGLGWGGVTLNTVAVICDLDLEGRMKLLETFGPRGRLIQAGLLKVEEYEDDEPDAVWCATLSLTRTGFKAIRGKLEVGDE
jgi:hypothetical protein